MQKRYIVFDVETPNAANNRISALGITVVEKDQIVESFSSLVNPEVHFDPFNISLTGITPKMVADQPTFPELWRKLEPLMDSGLLVAHNARFDLGVLAKCFQHYGIEWIPFAYYACTWEMSRVLLPELPNHKLSTLSSYFHIPLQHHEASSDSRACAEILRHFLRQGAELDDYIRSYEFLLQASSERRFRSAPSETSRKLSELQELLSDLTEDGQLTEAETMHLEKWLRDHDALRGNYPFDKIMDTVDQALLDGYLEKSELDAMNELFLQVADPVSGTTPCGDLDFQGKAFCLTGEFHGGTRKEVEERLTQRGGIPQSNVTKKTQVLVVGGRGSLDWSMGNYGNKVKKALEMQAQGIPIQILREEDLGDFES